MASDTEHDRMDTMGLKKQLDEEPQRPLDNEFLAGLPDDARLESGIPQHQRASVLDFISMTGLTRPAVGGSSDGRSPGRRPPERSTHDLDPAAPLSFYEQGVEDVDDSMGPPDARSRDEIIQVPGGGGQPAGNEAHAGVKSADAFRELVADLSRDITDWESRSQWSAPPSDPMESEHATEARPGEAESPVAELDGELLNLSEGSVPAAQEPDPAGVSAIDALFETSLPLELDADRPALAPKDELEDSEGHRSDINETDWDYPSMLAHALALEAREHRTPPPPAEALAEAAENWLKSTPSPEVLEALVAELSDAARQMPDDVPSLQTDSGQEFDALLDDFPVGREAGDVEETMTFHGDPASEDVPDSLFNAAEEAPLPEKPIRGPEFMSTDLSSHDALVPDEDSHQDFVPLPDPEPVRIRIGDASARLAEAEQLLHELEQQPRDTPGPDPHGNSSVEESSPVIRDSGYDLPSLKPSRFTGPPQNLQDIDEDNLVYSHSAAPGRRRSRRHSRRYHRFVRRAIVLLAVAVLILLGAMAYEWIIKPRLRVPEDFRALASKHMANSEYASASQAYEQFTRRYPDDPLRPEAQFNAAYALQLAAASGQSVDANRALREKTIALFLQFADENPNHPKRQRAETLMGILHFELGNYDEAENLLRRNASQTEDPDAALPILRTLAQVYLMRQEIERAESTLLQAAVLPKNYSADVDYVQAGVMFYDLSRIEEDRPTLDAYIDKAIGYWRKAAQVPGIDPRDRKSILSRIDALELELEGPVTPAPGRHSPVQLEPDPAKLHHALPAGAEAAVLETPLDWEQDAEAELRHMESLRSTETADGAASEEK